MKQIELTSKLVLAIIGLTSVSAILIPTYAAPAIKSGDIVDGEVKTADLATNAVTTPKIADNAVTSGKISNTDGVRSSDIVNGEVKAEDIAAGVIPSGAVQPTVHTEVGTGISLPPHTFGQDLVSCPDGEVATGGGYIGNSEINVSVNYPYAGTAWSVQGTNEGESDGHLTAWVICADFSP
jgi:hypothetical protein